MISNPEKEDYEELEISQRILKILEEAQRKIFKEGFQDFDAGMFDLDIDLKVTVDTRTVRIREKWKRADLP